METISYGFLSTNIAYNDNPNSAFKFFDTIDDNIDSIDATRIINTIIKDYPNFSPYNKNIKDIKDTFLEILNNEKYIKSILKYYDIDIQQFFKYLYGVYFNIFKGTYLKKIQKIMIDKKY